MSKLDFGGLKKKAKAATQEKPILPDPMNELTPLVAKCIENKKVVDARTAVLSADKSTLGRAAFAHACQLYAGRDVGIEDTFQIGTATGRATITLTNRYKVPEDLDPVKKILGSHANDVLRESYEITIDIDGIPEMFRASFVQELVALARATDAMAGTPAGEDGPCFNAVTVKEVNAVAKAFHEQRYSLLTRDQNLQLQQIMPCTTSVRLDY